MLKAKISQGVCNLNLQGVLNCVPYLSWVPSCLAIPRAYPDLLNNDNNNNNNNNNF